MINPVEILEIANWPPVCVIKTGDHSAISLETGKVLLLPKLDFKLTPIEYKLLSPKCADGKAKNISYDPSNGNLRGSALTNDMLTLLVGMLDRFFRQARGLAEALLPRHSTSLANGLTSYRPLKIEGREASVTKDDKLLHVDAFASRPNQGARILRVFSNVNPAGVPRVWEIGEPFGNIAARYAPGIMRSLPGSAWLLDALHITKGRRSEYDHVMLKLHNHMKRDTDYQNSAPRIRFEFPTGSTWICFSDCVAHAALSGQYLLEQTFYLPVMEMQQPRHAPLRVLEKLCRRPLA